MKLLMKLFDRTDRYGFGLYTMNTNDEKFIPTQKEIYFLTESK